MATSLKARQQELAALDAKRTQKWRSADCDSGIRAALPTWIRRLDVSYPLAACGSATEDIYIANLETGKVLACTNNEHDDDRVEKQNDGNKEFPDNLEQTVRLLFGSYDGGGTLAIAFFNALICHAGRKGGVNLWRLDPIISSQERGSLISQGSMRALEGVLVTCLLLDEDYLWVATADGRIQAYNLQGDLPLALKKAPDMEWNIDATIVSMSLCPQVGCGVVATSSGGVELFSMEEGGRSLASFYPPFDSMERKASNVHALCAVIVQHAKMANGQGDLDPGRDAYSIACGGNDGSLYVQPLQMIATTDQVDTSKPFTKPLRQLRPRHFAPLKCLASPAPGLLISGGLDGTLRVWDIVEAKCLYQFVGYKVWLGSLWTDGVRLVTDGADNTVILHNFESPGAAPVE
jgi:WD40 repeat protein